MGVHLTKKTTKPYRWIARTLPKTLRVIYVPDQDKLHFPAFFSKSTQREHIHHLIFFKRVLRFQLLQHPSYCSVYQNSGVGQKKMFLFRRSALSEHCSFQIIMMFRLLLVSKQIIMMFKLLLVSKLWV